MTERIEVIVAASLGHSRFAINRGSAAGVRQGMRGWTRPDTVEVIDPQTRQPLGTVSRHAPCGVTVTEVREKLAIVHWDTVWGRGRDPQQIGVGTPIVLGTRTPETEGATP
jgi:hypothetical protein